MIFRIGGDDMVSQNIPINDQIKVVHIKAYASLKIQGYEGEQVNVSSTHPDTLTVVKSGEAIYVTAMNSCELAVPKGLVVHVEKALGSVRCQGIQNSFQSEKILGHLVIDGAKSVSVEKIGGNCCLRNISDSIKVQKVGGNIIAENFAQLDAEKAGGRCLLKNGKGVVQIGKIGGGFSGERLQGLVNIEKVGGDYKSDSNQFGFTTKVGGDIDLSLLGAVADTVIHAGGDIQLHVPKGLNDIHLVAVTEGDLQIKAAGMDISLENEVFDRNIGNGGPLLDIKAEEGDILITDEPQTTQEVVGDLSMYFDIEERGMHEMIHDRVQKATELADKRIEAAQKRLDQMQSKFGVHIDGINIPSISIPPINIPPIPPRTKKGASDEERLLILQMLQEKKISVEEAETLFRSLEK